jgi:hypothetical protein
MNPAVALQLILDLYQQLQAANIRIAELEAANVEPVRKAAHN